MYRVAVCDDEKLLQEEICRMCGEILQDMGVQHKIQAFGSTKELLAALDVQEGFDLICLDIMMPEKNGMEFAYELRRRDEETSILFISSSTTYLLDGYGVRPVQYLLKPVQRAAANPPPWPALLTRSTAPRRSTSSPWRTLWNISTGTKRASSASGRSTPTPSAM